MKCQFCDTSISYLPVYFKHLSVYHKYKQSLTCVNIECLRKFVSISSLKKHIELCNKATYNVNNLKRKAIPESNDKIVVPLKRQCTVKTEPSSKKHSELGNKLSYNVNNLKRKASHESNNDKIVVPLKRQCTVTTENRSVSETIKENMLMFIAKLHGNYSISNLLVQEIVTEFIQFAEILTESFSSLKSILPKQYHESVNNMKYLHVLENFRTEFKRTQLLKRMNVLIEPQRFIIGEIKNDQRQQGTTVLSKKQCLGYIVPMREALKKFMELPNVFVEIENFKAQKLAQGEGNKIYTSVYQGERWKEISSKFDKKYVILLFIYYDDFEINNPLSSAAGIHKIGGLYYCVAGLPPQFASTIDNVFLGQFIYSADQKEFNAKCFTKLIEELKFLAEEGIEVCVNGEKKRIYFVVLGVLGDNLGLNAILGFNESFVSYYYCRICRAHKSECYSLCKESTSLLRTVDNYNEDLHNLAIGVKSTCIFNNIPHFHNTLNTVCDIMHDIYLGVARYDMAEIINYCIKSKYFTLKRLNERLKYFDYSNTDRGNKLTNISQVHLNNGCIVRTAAEMSFLISYFSIIVGDLVPEDDEIWDFFLILFQITDLVNSNTISEHDIIHLEQLIKDHNKLYIELFEKNLKPKYHLLIHYPRVIRRFGPMKYLSCQKFEAYHKKAKKYASLVTSRVNIISSLAKKNTLEFSFRLLIKTGLHNKIDFGHSVKSELTQVGGQSEFWEIYSVKVNNTLFKNNNIIYLSNNKENDPIFGLITKILRNVTNDVFFMYQRCETVGFISHLRAYEINMPHVNDKNVLFQYKNQYLRPITAHRNESKLFISLRDLE